MSILVPGPYPLQSIEGRTRLQNREGLEVSPSRRLRLEFKSFLASVNLYLGPLGDVVDSLVCFWTLGSEIRAPVSHVNWHSSSLPPPSPRHSEGRSVSLVAGNLHSLTRPIPSDILRSFTQNDLRDNGHGTARHSRAFAAEETGYGRRPLRRRR